MSTAQQPTPVVINFEPDSIDHDIIKVIRKKHPDWISDAHFYGSHVVYVVKMHVNHVLKLIARIYNRVRQWEHKRIRRGDLLPGIA